MDINKVFRWLIIAFLLVNTVNAQTPITSNTGGLTELIEAIQNNTRQQEEDTKKIEDMYGYIEEQNQKWIGINLIGNGLFITMLFLIMVFLDRLRRKKLKKSHEEYIKELEKELIATKAGLIETLKYTNDRSKELLDKINSLDTRYNELINSIKKPGDVDVKFYFFIGAMAGVILTSILFALSRGVV